MSTSRRTLLLVADSLEGGLGAAATSHARWFANAGWEVSLAAPAADDSSARPARGRHLAVPAGAFEVASMRAAVTELRAVLRHAPPDIVHAHGARSQLLTVMAGARPFVTMHGAGGRVPGQGRVGSVIRSGARRMAPLLAVGAFSAAPVPGWSTLLVASPRLETLDRMSAGSMADDPTFLWVGRLDAPKQPDRFVRALAQVAARLGPGRRVHGVMLGDGPLRGAVEELVRVTAAPVTLLGNVADPAEFASHLSQAWALCLFSGFEGIPFSVQEAMWWARPVVVSDLPSLRWFAGDAADYAADERTAQTALLELCERHVAIRKGSAAQNRVRELLVAGAPHEQLQQVYESRLTRASANARPE